ncbi:MAG TPA: transcription termination factor Rho [Actinomycetota bacterium]|nr:transcription termination factor Rho [Actinomycetota bacterium]
MDESQTQNRSFLAGKLVSELQAIAEQVGVKDPKKRKKAELIDAILGIAPQPLSPHAVPPVGNGATAATVNGVRHDEAVRGSSDNGGSEAPAAGPWASRGPDQPDQSEPHRGSDTTTAEESGSSVHEEPSSEPAAVGIPVGASEAPAETVPAPSGSNRSTHGPSVDHEYEAPGPEAAQPNGDAPASTATVQGSAEGSTDTSTPASPEASTQAPPQGPPDARPEYRREGEGVRERDRGRRRRRRERGGDRPERPGDRQERPDRGNERQDRGGADRMTDRMDRPRRETESEDTGELEVRTGVLDVLPEGYGFLRTSGYLPGQEDVYVSLSQVRRAQLRRGDHITGAVRRPKEGEKYQALVRIDKVDELPPDEVMGRKWFEKLTPLYPEERLHMELAENPAQISQRIIDLVAPIGKGQRGMIVSPPKAGKTTIMKQIANSITSNNPECHLIVLLVDERPEEVTDMQRSVEGEIVYSTFDRPSEDHIQVTELTLDRAKRLVELGRDVVILLDGITRLSRAYNLATPASGRILSGGVDSTALYPPKRFFGAARNIEQGGSLTIIATALVETGSRMDEVIFEEFKGTGNWELKLDRRASEKRIFPAIDIQASGTRKEELLLSQEELALVWKLRRVLHALDGTAALELLVDKMRQTKGNMQFLKEIQKVQIGD